MIAFDIFIQQAGTIITAFLLFIINVIIARFYGSSFFGEYTYILSICSMYAIIMDGGFKTLIFRKSVGDEKPLKLFKQSSFHLIMTASAGILILMCFNVNTLISCTAMGYFMLIVFSNFLFSHLKGRGDFFSEAWLKTSLHILVLIVFLILLISGLKTVAALFTSFIIAYLAWLLMLSKIRGPRLAIQDWKPTPLADYRAGLKPDFTVYKTCLIFTSIDLFTILYFRIDTVMLKYFLDSESVGIYNAGYKIIEAVIFLIAPVSHIFFQRIRKKIIDNSDQRSFFSTFLAIAAILAFIIAAILAFFSTSIISLIYGSQYDKASIILSTLAFSIIFIIPNSFLTQMCIALDLEKKYLVATVSCAVFNILINFMLIPILKTNGAAIATLVTEGLLFTLISIFLYKNRKS